MRGVLEFTYLTLLLIWTVICRTEPEAKLLMVTVASNATDGYHRFMRSARIYGYNVETLGMNQPWAGGDMNSAGGGYKINLLKRFMEKYKDDSKTLVLFTDSYDVIITASSKSVIKKFHQTKSRILFTAERFCWPDTTLSNQYPPVMGSSKYLNSGGFLGDGKSIYEMLTVHDVADTDDDQLYYTKLFLDADMRNDLGINLDYENEIFQALYGSEDDVKVRFREDDAYILNVEHNTEPALIHGNGLSKETLNMLGNYLARSWTPVKGCMKCQEDVIDLTKLDTLPAVCMGIFIEKPTPFLTEFFERITQQDYPKDRIHLFIHNTEEYHRNHVTNFTNNVAGYASVASKEPTDVLSEAEARNQAAQETITHDCDFHLSLDSEAMLTESKTIGLLVQLNRTVVAPMLVRPGFLWSNFWGALSDEGFYARSEDYGEILDYTKRGIWNVPYIRNAYMIRSDVIKNHFVPFVEQGVADVDITWCKNMREQGRLMYLSNLQYYGHLVNSESFDITLTKPEFYQLVNNKLDWEYRYIHQDYNTVKQPDTIVEQPCTDVYWFPLVTPAYATDLIAIMEGYGKWSNGKNDDARLQNGYENVPTRDIHMKQVGLERQWLLFLKDYVRPIQEKLYTGYYHDPPQAIMNFVVRYKPDEQPALRPHHDSSTYTINIALNTPNVDYEGGGCRFVRYNCSVVETRLGWTLIHPGRLTHFHEGLPVTKGTRYIMISFVDP
ncbi:hypothetical protein RvY_08960 [Ramazzottius varieornatus]|uniref:procollagen-lysine 5-dioxygenase n=1 Tax=Ramazzottius varieornatus TaxID=947166 RepID=A0A1D1V9W1_RAMVA|nr:hypothetical protein RvY_08960 [Ramazzottius varieornatus]